MGKTVKIDPILSQILLSVVDETAYLGGSVARRFFPTHRDLVRKLKPLSKKVTLATTYNSWITKSSSSQARISIRKLSLGMWNIPTASVCGTASHEPKLTSVQGLYF